MLRRTFLMKRSAMLVLLVFGVLLGGVLAQTESVLHTFCEQTDCADGSQPYAGLVFDQKGNLYGTTYNGGSGASSGCLSGRAGCGVIFKVTPEGSDTILYSFCAKSNCTDGELPLAGLVFDRNGNLYGTTDAGGAHGYGVVFKLTPEGTETVLYSFCAQGGNDCTDGRHPSAGVVFDRKGNLYGTTRYGGAYERGVVFRLTPKGKETVLHNFCAQGGSHCADGAEPQAGMIFDQKGNLYGTTYTGGAYGGGSGGGVVFKLTPKGKETVLYSFCAQNNCTDGADPSGGLIFDQKGNLYGTTQAGGANGLYGLGVVFKLTPKGKETVLYGFCVQTHCTDGSIPTAALAFDQKGDLYGTTYEGGAYEEGVVFKLTPEGSETVLYSFGAQTNGVDGAYPFAGLIFDQNGNLYGTTVGGGVYNSLDCPPEGCGVVFKLTP
jgi:uncharacterized repeat protein (TIGR03803 family)